VPEKKLVWRTETFGKSHDQQLHDTPSPAHHHSRWAQFEISGNFKLPYLPSDLVLLGSGEYLTDILAQYQYDTQSPTPPSLSLLQMEELVSSLILLRAPKKLVSRNFSQIPSHLTITGEEGKTKPVVNAGKSP
jgi:hypothetical protein